MTTALLAAPVRDLGDEYRQFSEAFIEARKTRDGSSWLLGDMLQGYEGRYGEMTMERLAADCGVSPQSCYEWCALAAFYAPTIRQHYQDEGLSYSHMRVVYRQTKDVEEAYTLLDLIKAQKWSVAQAAVELKKLRGASVPPATLNALVTFKRVGDAWMAEGLEDMDIVEGQPYKIASVR